MKTLNYFLKGSWMLIKVLFVPLVFIIGCTKQDITPVGFNENLNEMNPKNLVAVNDVVCLEGTSNFNVYAPKEGRVVVSPDEMFLTIEATLTHVEGQNYLLKTTETMPPPLGPFLYRIIEWDVKISAGGVVKFSWPKSWWELGTTRGDVLGQILEHTGCIVAGPGINKGTIDYNGYFDGVNFYAAMHLTGKQVQKPGMSVYAGIIGPVKFLFSMTLSKVACK
jgi:hypothetical protein